jgi:hypothetical protein
MGLAAPPRHRLARFSQIGNLAEMAKPAASHLTDFEADFSADLPENLKPAASHLSENAIGPITTEMADLPKLRNQAGFWNFGRVAGFPENRRRAPAAWRAIDFVQKRQTCRN